VLTLVLADDLPGGAPLMPAFEPANVRNRVAEQVTANGRIPPASYADQMGAQNPQSRAG